MCTQASCSIYQVRKRIFCNDLQDIIGNLFQLFSFLLFLLLFRTTEQDISSRISRET